MAGRAWRVCTYNIFEGLDGQDARRVASFRGWVASQGLDVVGLNEANGFTPEGLQALALECGLPHCHLRPARTGFHLGVMSRHALELYDTSEVSGRMHHGLLHVLADLGDLKCHLLVTHLTPFEASKRRSEAEAIVKYIEPYLNEPLLLLGDLNSLSRLDRVLHGHDQMLVDTVLKAAKLRRKFCQEDGAIDYAPIDILYGCGLVDAGGGGGGSDPPDSATIPTPANRDSAHVGGRLDYILLGPAIASPGGGGELRARTVKDAATDFTSDHYPVVLDMPMPERVRAAE